MGVKNDTNPTEILELGKLSELRNLLIGLNQTELERFLLKKSASFSPMLSENLSKKENFPSTASSHLLKMRCIKASKTIPKDLLTFCFPSWALP